jgi:hypothetical protein
LDDIFAAAAGDAAPLAGVMLGVCGCIEDMMIFAYGFKYTYNFVYKIKFSFKHNVYFALTLSGLVKKAGVC